MDIEKNYERLIELVDSYLEDRAEPIKAMYEDLHERLLLAPASSIDHYHNAFPGGYLDHVLRVTDNALGLYTSFQDMFGLSTEGFDEGNVVFAALHHDLGKLGFPYEGGEIYVPNKSEWHRKNLGKVYEFNDKNPFALTVDLTMYLLQYYSIPMNWVEYQTIRITDGLYDDINKPYYIARTETSKLRSNLPYLLHTADLFAARKEYEMWKNSKPSTEKVEEAKPNMNYGKRGRAQKIKNIAAKQSGSNSTTPVSGSSEDAMDLFNKLFN